MKIPTDAEMRHLLAPAGGPLNPAARGVLLTTRQVSELLNVPRETLSNWRKARPCPTGPRFYRIAGQVRYAQPDLDAWLASCRVETS